MLLITSALNVKSTKSLGDIVGKLPGISYLEDLASAQSADYVQQFLNADKENKVLILVEFAADALASGVLNSSEAMAQQAQKWQQQVETLFTLHKFDRKRIRLVSFQSAQFDPYSLEADFGVVLKLPKVSPGHCLNSLLASQWLINHPELSSIDQRLRASSRSYNEAALTAYNTTSAIELIFQQQQKLIDNDQQLAKLSDDLANEQKDKNVLAAENEVLVDQLHQVQEGLEKSFLENKDLKNRLNEADKDQKSTNSVANEFNSLSQLLAQERSKNKEMSEEKDLILRQLHIVQEELENYYHKFCSTENSKSSQINQFSEKSLLEARKATRDSVRLVQMEESYSWRLTKVFRLAVRLYPKLKAKQHMPLLKASDLFDESWYLERYPDVAKAGLDPAFHYLRHGAKEGRNPSPSFETRWYLQQYPDVKKTKINPLVHYILYGIDEKRKVSADLLAH